MGKANLATGLQSHCHTKVDEWVNSMVMHYHSKGRPLHNQNQLDINANALTLWHEMNGPRAAVDGFQGAPAHGQHGLVNAVALAQDEKPPGIIHTPDGRPMAVSKSQGRLLHRAESGGANDWEMVTVPGGRVIIRSPSKGHQAWLDSVVNGDTEAWPSPPPEDPEHKRRRMDAESTALAHEASVAANATRAHNLLQVANVPAKASDLADPGDLRHMQVSLQAHESALAAAVLAKQLAEQESEAKGVLAIDMQQRYQGMEAHMAVLKEQLRQATFAKAMAQAECEHSAKKEAVAKVEEDARQLVETKAKLEEAKAEEARKHALDVLKADQDAITMAERASTALALAVAKAKVEEDAKAEAMATVQEAIKLQDAAHAIQQAETQAKDEQDALTQLTAKEQEEADAMKRVQAQQEEDDKQAKTKAWNDKMCLAKAKEAADEAWTLEHKREAMEQQAASEEVEKAKATSLNLLGLMAQHARRPASLSHACRCHTFVVFKHLYVVDGICSILCVSAYFCAKAAGPRRAGSMAEKRK